MSLFARVRQLTALVALPLATLAAPASSTAAPAEHHAGISASKADTDAYTVEIKPASGASAGKEAHVEITLKAKGDHHINDKYPIKFKAADPAPDGVAYSKPIAKREDGRFGEKEGTLPFAFTASKPGKIKIAGNFAFSVCTDKNCLMEKVDLEVDVDVK